MKKIKIFLSLMLATVSAVSLSACNKGEEISSEKYKYFESSVSDESSESYEHFESSDLDELSETVQSSEEASDTMSIDSSSITESSAVESEADSNNEDNNIRSIIEGAYSSADRGEWDEAVQSLEEAQLVYTDNDDINSAYEDIKRKMPISLSNIVTISSECIEVLSDPIKDRYGNVYDGGVQYDASYNAFGLYNLDKKYTKFNATAFVSTEAKNGKKISISIYLDNKLAFYKDGITEETKPLEISLDVSNASTMRISTSNEGSFSYGRLIFADTDFTKVDS